MRWYLSCKTVSNILISLSSCNSCMRMSNEINVPVRPTPALNFNFVSKLFLVFELFEQKIYLQWTSTRPFSHFATISLTVLQKLINKSVLWGQPWSGHSRKWRCTTVFKTVPCKSKPQFNHLKKIFRGKNTLVSWTRNVRCVYTGNSANWIHLTATLS